MATLNINYFKKFDKKHRFLKRKYWYKKDLFKNRNSLFDTDLTPHSIPIGLTLGIQIPYYGWIAVRSANRFNSLDVIGAQPPELGTESRGFFNACRTVNRSMVDRVGEPQGSPVPMAWSVNPVRSASLFNSEVAGHQPIHRSLP